VSRPWGGGARHGPPPTTQTATVVPPPSTGRKMALWRATSSWPDGGESRRTCVESWVRWSRRITVARSRSISTTTSWDWRSRISCRLCSTEGGVDRGYAASTESGGRRDGARPRPGLACPPQRAVVHPYWYAGLAMAIDVLLLAVGSFTTRRFKSGAHIRLGGDRLTGDGSIFKSWGLRTG
jgi:hypothetical protein